MSTSVYTTAENTRGGEVRLVAAEAYGAYRTNEYNALLGRSLALLAVARRNGAPRDTARVVIEPRRAVEELVEAYDNDEFERMAELAGGLHEIARTKGDA